MLFEKNLFITAISARHSGYYSRFAVGFAVLLLSILRMSAPDLFVGITTLILVFCVEGAER
jgi:hypothetical protein